MREMTPPPRPDRNLGHACAVMGMNHEVRRGCDGAGLGREPCAPAEQEHVAGLHVLAIDLDEMPPRRREQRLRPARLGPIGRIGRRRLWLRTQDRAPDPAQQAEAIAPNALQRGLMPVRRADPASGFVL